MTKKILLFAEPRGGNEGIALVILNRRCGARAEAKSCLDFAEPRGGNEGIALVIIFTLVSLHSRCEHPLWGDYFHP